MSNIPHLPGARLPFQPFPDPVPVPVAGPLDEPLVCIQINREWVQYVLGCLQALVAESTWASTNPTVVRSVITEANNLIAQIASLEACPMPVTFRLNPTDPHYWDYSTDSGATWTRQPDTVAHFTPTFQVDGAAPAGYDISVNGGITWAIIPLLTATDPTAVITDPSTLLRNEITAGSGIDGLVIQALATIGVKLQSNGVAAAFQKIPGLGLAADAVTQIAQGDGYIYPLLAIVTGI